MTCWRSTSVISLFLMIGLAPDAIFSHHRDTDGHSNWSHIITRLYLLSACDGEKIPHCRNCFLLPYQRTWWSLSSTTVNTSCVNLLSARLSLLIIIQASASRFWYPVFSLLVPHRLFVRVILAVARSKFHQRQYFFNTVYQHVYYCYKCFF